MRFPRPSRDILVLILAVVLSVIGLGFVYGLTVLQFLKDGLVVGSIYVLGATGLSLIFGIRKFANFAHGELMTFGAYMAFLVNVLWAADIIWGLLFAIVATAGVAMTMELLVFHRLAGRGPVPALVASIGITIFLQNLINLTFGTSIQIYNLRVAVDIDLLAVNGVSVLSINPLKGVLTLAVATLLIVLLHLFLSRTTLGKAMRATADNPDLARTSGIKIRNVILWTWIISGAMAAVAGVLLGIVTDVRPGLGFHILLFVFAAVIVGGLGSPYGAMVGGLLVGIAQALATGFLGWLGRPSVIGLQNPTTYSPIAAFLIMILVLLLRPGGLVSGKLAPMSTGRRRFRLPFLSHREV
jgi:branched-chain amino acid transport system permease protein/neutral amino acid transport system permease protein